MSLSTLLHALPPFTEEIPSPSAFTYPHCYTPHPLCITAAKEVQNYLVQQQQWQEEIAKGKMFGVLVVADSSGRRYFLAAFSGILAGSNQLPYFVPPIYDLLQPTGYFKEEEQWISVINKQIEMSLANPVYSELHRQLSAAIEAHTMQQQVAKERYRIEKRRREERRKANPSDSELIELLQRESQHQKAEIKRAKRRGDEQIAILKEQLLPYEKEIDGLKEERKSRSAQLQQWLFEHYRVRNGLGECSSLGALFAKTTQRVPPAGSGECAAPKLLQYAYLHGLTPLAMAEFWWGASPTTIVRKEGCYYPACQSKCAPILAFMLQGIEVEPNPLAQPLAAGNSIEIVYEDDYLLVVNKPHGMLSTPGKEGVVSLYELLRKRYPEAMMVHRLDMDTSGLLLVAKSLEIYKTLQAQFARREVHKRYEALLEGRIEPIEGEIELPLCLDPTDRPKQQVSYEYGKQAITHYRVLAQEGGRTRIALYPYTGRTHQLRLHAAHSLGLNTPIVGDRLYGAPSERLCLHAASLVFVHPVSKKQIVLSSDVPF